MVKRKEDFRRAKKLRRTTPARSIRAAVRKRGGDTSKVIFAKENMLDQTAYMRVKRAIDIGLQLGWGQNTRKGAKLATVICFLILFNFYFIIDRHY